MKNNLISLLIGGLIVFLLMRSCEKSPASTSPRTGSLTNIETIYHTDTIVLNDFKPVYRDKIQTIIKENQSIKIMYDTATVEVKDSICLDALTLRKFDTTFENKDIHAVVSGLVQGHVKVINFDYLIKPEPLQKQKQFSLSGGFGADFNATTPVLKVGVGYKSTEFDYIRMNNQNFGVISYRIRF